MYSNTTMPYPNMAYHDHLSANLTELIIPYPVSWFNMSQEAQDHWHSEYDAKASYFMCFIFEDKGKLASAYVIFGLSIILMTT